MFSQIWQENTLLFASMLVQNQAHEGEGSAVHPEPQPTPSTSQPNVSEPQIASLHIETSPIAAPQTEAHQTAGIDTGGRPRRQDTWGVLLLRLGLREYLHNPMNHLSYKVTHLEVGRAGWNTLLNLWVLNLEKEKDAQAVEILNLTKRVKKLERKRKSSISHTKRRKYRQVETSSNNDLDEEDASKQGRRSDKLKPMFKDKDFEELDDHIENVEEETVDAAATKVSTISAPVSTTGVTISTTEPRTPPTTTTIFDDEDVTMAMAQTLIKMKEHKAKEKGVAITDVEDSSRIIKHVRSITTLQPLLTIHPKDKGKGVLVEEEPVKIKMRDQGDLQVQANAELAQRLHEEELAELERAQQERQRQKDDTHAALAKEFDEIQARIDADHELAKETIGSSKSRGNKKQTTYTNSSQEQVRKQDDLLTIKLYSQWIQKLLKIVKKKVDSSSKPARGSKKKTLAKKEQVKRKVKKVLNAKKLRGCCNGTRINQRSDDEISLAADYEHEKEELRMWLTVVSDYWLDLHRFMMKMFEETTLEGYNLLLWGDLKLGVLTLLMDGTLTSFNMLVEKRYPLIKEMLQKMLNWKLEAEAESTITFELLKFI
ncbi:hypothetical protein Tco_0215317 [Tanacetum coccineum]